jgi:hypothetical protein
VGGFWVGVVLQLTTGKVGHPLEKGKKCLCSSATSENDNGSISRLTCQICRARVHRWAFGIPEAVSKSIDGMCCLVHIGKELV